MAKEVFEVGRITVDNWIYDENADRFWAEIGFEIVYKDDFEPVQGGRYKGFDGLHVPSFPEREIVYKEGVEREIIFILLHREQ